MTKIEYQILVNQIAIMAGLKEFMSKQIGHADAARSVCRLDPAIVQTATLLQSNR